MNNAYIIYFIAGGIFLLGFLIGYSSCPCSTNPQNVDYWKQKVNETNNSLNLCQEENKVLTSSLFNLLINSYAKKIIWSVSGLSNYRLICSVYNKNNSEILPELKSILDTLCNQR